MKIIVAYIICCNQWEYFGIAFKTSLIAACIIFSENYYSLYRNAILKCCGQAFNKIKTMLREKNEN